MNGKLLQSEFWSGTNSYARFMLSLPNQISAS
jgi:hypothetical protein